MNKTKEDKLIKYLSIAATLFFIVWGIITIYTRNTEFIFDRFFSAGICLLVFLIYKKLHLRLYLVIFALAALILHHLKLYGNVYIGIPFDRIMHFIAVAAIAAIFYQYLYIADGKKSKLKASILAVLIAVGIASLLEILEFIGYSFLGEGEGLLFYGTGDFGEWNNISWDLISNTLGAIVAIIFMSIAYSYKSIKKQIKIIKTSKILKTTIKYLKPIILILAALIISFYISQITPATNIDPYADYDFNQILDSASIDKTQYIDNLTAVLAQDNSNFAKADAYLILGRLTNNQALICASTDFYSLVENTLEEKALAYETIASLNCRKNSKEYYLKAAKIWNILGNDFRAELDTKLGNNEKITLEYKEQELQEKTKKLDDWNMLFIGNSYIKLDSESVLLSQTDRVTRDWLSFQLQKPFSTNLLTTFSERLSYTEEELLPEIGWHEGARIKELQKVNLTHKIASGTLAAKINNKWYAPDENGLFQFEIPEDKLMYPTTRYLTPNLAIIIDTHGINMLVEQAIRYKADTVLGCCDHPGKIQAAKYLSDKGINVICLTDRFVPDLLFSKANVLGSAPIKIKDNQAIIGAQPITINKNDKIIAMDIDESSIYAIQYYDTPARYFKNLEKSIKLDINYVKITNFNQMLKIIYAAESEDATVIAVRIFNSNDYNAVKFWLEQDKNNKAILFHSVSYPYGYKLLKEFPKQTTFDDINPDII